ncbi:MAG: helix-turn-helix transcriptional regulator [Myxococcaceae bacterium]
MPAEIKPAKNIELAFSVRYHRLKHGLSQKDAAKKMGFSDIFSYQRLESSRSNPTLKTLWKLRELFPEFSLDQSI